MKVVLETERTYLREMDDSDLSSLLKIISNPTNLTDEEYGIKWINWCKDSYQKYGFGHLAVILKDTNKMIGSAGVSMQFIDDEWKPEIGYHIRKDYQRRGLAKEVASALRDYFFAHYDYDEVYSYMEEDNLPSYKTALSIGMEFLHLYEGRDNRIYRVYYIKR